MLCVAHHLPQQHAVAPHVTAAGELAVGDGLGSRPAHRDLASLEQEEEEQGNGPRVRPSRKIERERGRRNKEWPQNKSDSS